MIFSLTDQQALLEARHSDPFSILGWHTDSEAAGGYCLRVCLPGAQQVTLLGSSLAPKTLAKLDTHLAQAPDIALMQNEVEGFFSVDLNLPRPEEPYSLRVIWADGQTSTLVDPYCFGPLLGEFDVWLLAEGNHLRPFEVLGAHPRAIEGVTGTSFAVWAPNASRVSVVGDFNRWDGRRHPMRLRRECGIWEIFLPGVGEGVRYKFEVRTAQGQVVLKADPYAFAAELRPATASIVTRLPPSLKQPVETKASRHTHQQPMSIYEVHLTSWRRVPEEGGRWLTWDELAETLLPYVQDLGFTHVELMPITEHPFDGSWGYQTLGLYTPTARLGEPDGLRRFVTAAHQRGIGVILDWVPAHFPADAYGLAQFDGTALYEHADPREGYHQDWNTLIYNYGRREVCNFLLGSALFWLEQYDIDGLRVDAVASMLYRDYSRAQGEWVPNQYGGRENLEAMAFLRRLNTVIAQECPGKLVIAEESTAFPGVSRAVEQGGLGFSYKWNMGWMHDTLAYFQQDPVHRRYHHHQLTFGLLYAFSEHFVLPLSHDEVVHGKGALLSKMPGDRWQQFANLRAYFAFMWTHPGKKLLFMGGELAQPQEWNFQRSLDWHLLQYPEHNGVQRLVRDLNQIYRTLPAFYGQDSEPTGFQWLVADDSAQSVYAYGRWGKTGAAKAENDLVVVIANLTPVPRNQYRFGVPRAGTYGLMINTDAAVYGGSGYNLGLEVAEGIIQTQFEACHGLAQSLVLNLPPLAVVILSLAA